VKVKTTHFGSRVFNCLERFFSDCPKTTLQNEPPEDGRNFQYVKTNYFFRVSNKASKTIGPSGKPEGNTVHRMHYVVSLEIDLNGWL
jgi:hypothetical protein